ncbi:mechanosensitive ion channel family protein [Bacteroides sp. 214]|uniref:mechanosensitive ion channel family protein n=1 Tax=Bacteroides sp. 214 TaxID=2302935 RepID=UPI0013D17CD3|nr:mechanosensitive ion channel family protein [Bacteroides sp. 214]NDW13383.1 mechanosensitive ion channel family protein [Bacteroides sp. 214]
MLDTVIWDNSVQQWGIFAIVLLCTLVVMKLVSVILKKVIKPLVLKSANTIDDIFYNSIESPIRFGIVLLGLWIALLQLTLSKEFFDVIEISYTILVILNVTWLISRFCSNLLDEQWQKNKGHQEKKIQARMMPIIKRTVLTIVWLIGSAIALSNTGVNITALISTLGIGGIAFALAAQDTIKNIFAAFTILTDRPFTIGDVIRVDSHEGTIIDIGIRSTKMRNYDKRIITFPNYKVADTSIVNISSEPMRRITMKLGLTYNTSPEKMKEAMDILQNIPNKVQHVSPKDLKVYFSDFADSALIITFIFFIEKKGDKQAVISNTNMEILTAFNTAGLDFAFPTQTIYLEKE